MPAEFSEQLVSALGSVLSHTVKREGETHVSRYLRTLHLASYCWDTFQQGSCEHGLRKPTLPARGATSD